jgi:hypothetical protein
MHIALQQSPGMPVATTYFCKNAVTSRQLDDFTMETWVTRKSPEPRKPAWLRAIWGIGTPLFTGLSTSSVWYVR